jgi:hypothetical protein
MRIGLNTCHHAYWHIIRRFIKVLAIRRTDCFFGREPKLPTDLKWGLRTYSRPADTYHDYVDQTIDQQVKDFQLARETLGRAAEGRKQYYDARVRPVPDFDVGDQVFYWCPRKLRGLCPKWQCLWSGPFTIIRVIDRYNYVIRKSTSRPIV